MPHFGHLLNVTSAAGIRCSAWYGHAQRISCPGGQALRLRAQAESAKRGIQRRFLRLAGCRFWRFGIVAFVVSDSRTVRGSFAATRS